jgi:RNA polymerase sigma-70 factor (ECF subfamily)
VAGFAGRILADSAEAEDVAQETFLRLWREADRWQPRARLSAWLFRVAYNLCIDRIRKRRGMIGFDTIADPPSPARNAEERLAEAEIAARVEQAIGALPARQRAAIALVHQQGLGNIEAASVLGISVEALESLLARGRRQLKDILSPLSAGEGGGR